MFDLRMQYYRQQAIGPFKNLIRGTFWFDARSRIIEIIGGVVFSTILTSNILPENASYPEIFISTQTNFIPIL